jgi:hydroxymethylglutaryl-CoA lyase
MNGTVKIVESPRVAWQSLPRPIPADLKADYLRVLLAAGFEHVDAFSFVSAGAVPQMADTEQVLEQLLMPNDVEVIAMVANARGADRAVAAGSITTLLFSYSISPGFLEANQHQTPEDALEELEQVGEIAYKAGLDLTASIAMAFGNPYGDTWDIDEVVSATDLLLDAGVAQVMLDDTIGEAAPGLLHDVLQLVRDVHNDLDLGLALRTTPDGADAKIRAAYTAGCRRFQSVLGGVGGNDFASDGRVGSLATETLLQTLADMKAPLPDLEPLHSLIAASRGIEQRFGAIRQ